MEKLLKELIKHKTLKKQYKHLVTSTQSTQTQTEPDPEDQGTHVEPSGDYIVEEPTSNIDIDEPNGKITPLLPLFLKAIGEHDDVVRMESPTEHKGAETPAVPMEILPGPSGAQDGVVRMVLTEHTGSETQTVPMEFFLDLPALKGNYSSVNICLMNTLSMCNNAGCRPATASIVAPLRPICAVSCGGRCPPLQILRKSLIDTDSVSESEWVDKLNTNLILDGESISSNIHNLELLLVARAVLTCDLFPGSHSAKWWRLRSLFVHQQVLEERSPSLYKEMTILYDELTEVEAIRVSSELYSQLLLEMTCVWLHYGYIGSADQSVKTALKVLQCNIALIGAMGKRTKFQQKELAQLTIHVDVNRDAQSDVNQPADVSADLKYFPKDVKLDDEVRLSQIAFSDARAGEIPVLTAAEQAAIMASCVHRQKSQPKDRLHAEEILPYLICLTNQPHVWALQMSALLQRSKIDSEDKRTVERSLMQYQTLMDSISSADPSPISRLTWFFGSYLPPAWRIEALLADVYISLGMVQTALDVFLRLQLWEEVIACYNYLKLRHKAAEIIRQELEKKCTVKLLCLLGDATDDVGCYQQAWELSGHRSGRAQRHWAMFYFSRKQYGESIPHFEESLRLNSLQESLWFRLGFAALDQEKWELCATAYRRYCTLEPESFEAWNNLAKAYVMQGQKARAFHALQEAVKCNYENWKVWDNLMAVSTDCGQFEEVIRCYHRILDIKEKHVDLEVLKILTNVIVKGNVKINQSTIEQLKKQSLKLFGRLTSQVLNNSTLWQLYAQLAASDEATPENKTKVAQCLQKAYRAGTQGSWEQDITTCQQVIDLCVELAKAYVLCSNQCGTPNETIQMLSSAKLPLRSVLLKIEKEHTDLITGELPESLTPKYKELLSHYENIVDEIQKLQDQ